MTIIPERWSEVQSPIGTIGTYATPELKPAIFRLLALHCVQPAAAGQAPITALGIPADAVVVHDCLV